MPLSDLLARPWAESQLVLEAAGVRRVIFLELMSSSSMSCVYGI